MSSEESPLFDSVRDPLPPSAFEPRLWEELPDGMDFSMVGTPFSSSDDDLLSGLTTIEELTVGDTIGSTTSTGPPAPVTADPLVAAYDALFSSRCPPAFLNGVARPTFPEFCERARRPCTAEQLRRFLGPTATPKSAEMKLWSLVRLVGVDWEVAEKFFDLRSLDSLVDSLLSFLRTFGN